ncbi:ABC transporter ATP-binding protein [Laceyella tengchongensis]
MNLTIKDVSKHYGKKRALHQLNLELDKGVWGFLGPNGAGKSTMMKILATIDQPTEGTVTWNGVDIVKHPLALRSELGYLPQDFGVYPNLNAIEFLEYMAAIKGLPMKQARKRIDELLELLNLTNDAQRMIGGYSGGMKQRVGIAQALLNDPQLLIVDEPTVGLDPTERIRFRNLLSQIGKDRIIILSTHIVSDVETIANQIILIRQGSLIANAKPETLLEMLAYKLWECVIPAEELDSLQKNFIVSHAVHRSDGLLVRVVSDEPPAPDAENVPASLEDVYLYYTMT